MEPRPAGGQGIEQAVVDPPRQVRGPVADERAAQQCRDWQDDEDAWFAADGTRARADVVVDGAARPVAGAGS